MQLSRVTTQYDNAQDRFRLLGDASDDETLELWLTQRLFMRILQVLFAWLEENDKSETVSGSRPEDPQVKSSLQNFAQQSASAAMEKTEPVKAQSETRSYLLDEVDIRKSDTHIDLVFKLPQGEIAELLFDTTQLRQWLNIVLKQWIAAEWPIGIWPDWMRQAHDETAVESTSVLFH